jgi:putative transposase
MAGHRIDRPEDRLHGGNAAESLHNREHRSEPEHGQRPGLTSAGQADPARRAQRWQRDRAPEVEIDPVCNENRQHCAVRKLGRQLLREGWPGTRGTAASLICQPGLRGVVHDKQARTTVSDQAQPCPLDKVHRPLHADRPNARWVSDFTDISTHKSFVCLTFVVALYARHIVGWKPSSSMSTDFVRDVLNQGRHARHA